MGRKLIISVLALSVAGNVFLGGYITGRVLNGSPHHMFGGKDHKGPPPHRDGSKRPSHRMNGDEIINRAAIRQISDEGRTVFREVFGPARDDMRASRQKRREAYDALVKVASAEPFEAAAVEQAIAEFNAHNSALRSLQQKGLVEALGRLSVEDRKKLLTRRAGGKGHRGDKFRGDKFRGKRKDGWHDGPPSPPPDGHDLPPPPESDAPADNPDEEQN